MITRAQKYRGRILGELHAAKQPQTWLAVRLGISRGALNQKLGGAAFTEDEMREIQKIFGWRTLEGEE